MKKTWRTLIIVCSLAALSACQEVFTYSPVAFLERGAATLSTPQKIEHAMDILIAGTDEQRVDAYVDVAALIVAGDTSAETNLLAADLAFSASGLSDVIFQILQNPDIISSATAADFTSLFEALDANLIAVGAWHIRVAHADVDAVISETQYVVAGAALLMSAVEKAGRFSIIAWPPVIGEAGYDEFLDAIDYLAIAGIDDPADMYTLDI
jgi:hypothetical protein